MVDRHMLLDRELIKQSTLIHLPLTHHRLHSPFDNWRESVQRPQRNLRLFQQNRTKAVIEVTRRRAIGGSKL
jgi:hypothetical protein